MKHIKQKKNNSVSELFPLLVPKQQVLILELIKAFLNVDDDLKRISTKQYIKEINDTTANIENENLKLRRQLLGKKMKKESKLVRDESLKVLREFEK